MGRDTYLFVFIGRKCTEEEQQSILENLQDDPDYYDKFHIFELDFENPIMKIDGYPVVVISNCNVEVWYICEKYINAYDIEHGDPIELDSNIFDETNKNHKLMMVSEISF